MENYEDLEYLTDNNSCIVYINATHYYMYDVCDPCATGSIKPKNMTVTHYNHITITRTLSLVVLMTAIFGIILTIIVLSRKHMCTSTNCYLISLAVSDLGFLVILSTRWLETEVLDYLTYDIYFKYAQIFIDTFLMASVWVTVMLAIERYIAICHSLRANTICTVKRAVMINVLVFVCSFLCRIPNFFEYSIKTAWMYEGCVQVDRQYIHLTPLGRNVLYKTIYSWIFDCILCATVPFLALLYLNIRLIIEIRKSTHYLMDTLGNDTVLHNVLNREQRRVTLMLISIVIVFFICQAPYVSLSAYRSIQRYSLPSNPFVLNIVLEIATFLLTLKSALNFILYCWFSEKFWETFKKELCRKLCIFLKRNRDIFSSRTHSDSHNNSANQKSHRKTTSASVNAGSMKMKERIAEIA